MRKQKKEWFAEWFDSPFYHILYRDHNEQEAHDFLDRIIKNITPQYLDRRATSEVRMLDLACGKGRHSRYLAAQGFDVVGLDLSKNSIAFAKQFEQLNLTFFQHDMRKPFRINYFDYIFNVFTSFGYFDNDTDNLRILQNVALGLKPHGTFVFDFFNANFVRQNLQSNYDVTKGGIDFKIQKTIIGDRILKKIDFHIDERVLHHNSQHRGSDFHFTENVRLFLLADFEKIFAAAGLQIIEKFGSYQLDPFNINTSTRLIIKALRA